MESDENREHISRALFFACMHSHLRDIAHFNAQYHTHRMLSKPEFGETCLLYRSKCKLDHQLGKTVKRKGTCVYIEACIHRTNQTCSLLWPSTVVQLSTRTAYQYLAISSLACSAFRRCSPSHIISAIE